MTTMRAKVQVQSVKICGFGTPYEAEELTFFPVAKSGNYPADGLDEDNTYARFTPAGQFQLTVANPNLHRKFKQGDKFYVDFTPAD